MTDTSHEQQPKPDRPRHRRRWVMPLLFVSLAVNLLVAGLVVGHALSPDARFDREGRPARGVIGEPFIRALPDADRRALMRDVMQDRDRIRESRESLKQRFEAFLAALRAVPFDSDEVRRLLLEQREAAVGRQAIGEALLMKRLDEMSDDERAAYADRLEESLARLRRR